MTHLKIEQNTTGIEEVSHSIIEKLYNLAISGDLDASSNLLGRLHVPATYRSYIDYLTTNYPNLYITSSDYYVNFADPEVRRIFALSNYGDGFGLLLSTALTITNLNNVTISGTGNLFKNNTTIEHFDELGLFTRVTSIPLECFKDCTNLTEVVLPNTVTEIGSSAFLNCSSLQSISLDNITSIGLFAFKSCSSLESVTLSENITSIEKDTFSASGLTSITIPSNVAIIKNYAFSRCSNLSTINFAVSNTLTTILYNAFLGCIMTELSIPEGVISIGDSAFTECRNLQTVVLPSTIETIGALAFRYDSRITSFTIKALNVPELVDIYSFDGGDFPIYVPAESVDAYKAAENWSTYADRIQAIPN